MEMESSRRPFSRSNEPGLKKPRLAENPNGRAFGQRPVGGANPVLSRFRVSDRNVGSDDANRGGGGYVPQPLQHQELVSQYKTALAELTFNSKPIITNLTIIAGENVHAAKSVAATVCGNIIEVPSEQKLPSLYLLDSIVKNIGRDYIKYFAARLPEVFCKAYRQVEPPIHQSMRHLFGTWKGVFPAQTLQMIEKELGFSSTANGSSSGAATSRPDSQSQRPAHSIHVNPKYLERQRLQQPARAKGMASDFSGVTANSIDDDAEMLARAASISAGRPWVDPAVNLHRSNTDALSARVHEENIGAEYGEYEYGSDLHRNSNPGMRRIGGKITETLPTQRNGFNIKHGLTNYSAPKSTNADPRLKTAPGIATRNSGGLSSSWKNSEEEEFMWDDMNSRLTDHGPPDISSNSRKDHGASDDSEKLGFGGQLRKPKGVNDYASTADLDTSADPTEQKDLSALGQRMSSPWTLQDSIGVDRLTPSGTPVISSVHSERYASSLSGLSTSGDSSVARMGSRAQVASSRIGTSCLGFNAAAGPTGALGKQQLQSVRAASPSEQSSMHQYSPSPTSAVHPRHHSQSLADQDFAEDPLPIPTPNVRLGSKAKTQPQDISSSIPDIQSSHKYPFRQQPDSIESESFGRIKKPHVPQVSTFSTPSTVGDSIPGLSNVLSAESSGQLSTSSLLAAVMKTGILSDKSITFSLPNLNRRDMGHIPSESGVQPPLQSGPSPTLALPGPKVASAPSSGHLSGENSPASSNVSQKKVAHLPIPPSQPPSSLDGSASESSTVVNNASDPISNLLSSLVAKGLISASKSESPTPVPSQKLTEPHNKSLGAPASKSVTVSPVSVSVSPSRPVTSQTDDASLPEPVAKTSAAVPQSTKTEIRNLIGVAFKPDKIREFHPAVIDELFNDLPHTCSICGLRLKLKERLERHLKWHASKNPEGNGSVMASRKWYPDLTSWVAGRTGPPLVLEAINSIDEPNEMMDIDEPIVPADENQCVCVICGGIFEDFYCQERDEWMFKGASYMSIPSGAGEMETTEESVLKGPIVHVNCTVESSLSDLGLPGHVKLEPEI